MRSVSQHRQLSHSLAYLAIAFASWLTLGRPCGVHAATSSTAPRAVSVWILDKRALHDPDRPVDNRPIIAQLEQEAKQTLKLRHPGIVRVIEPLEETRTHLFWVTEEVQGSLMSWMLSIKVRSACLWAVLYHAMLSEPTPCAREVVLGTVTVRFGRTRPWGCLQRGHDCWLTWALASACCRRARAPQLCHFTGSARVLHACTAAADPGSSCRRKGRRRPRSWS